METENIPTVPAKVCTKCGVEYPATREFFPVNKSGKYGLGSICKKCICLISAKWYARNHEKIKASKKKTVLKILKKLER